MGLLNLQELVRFPKGIAESINLTCPNPCGFRVASNRITFAITRITFQPSLIVQIGFPNFTNERPFLGSFFRELDFTVHDFEIRPKENRIAQEKLLIDLRTGRRLIPSVWAWIKVKHS